MRMKIAKEEIPTHPVEYLPEDDISALPVLPMTQSADGTWYCDGESTQETTKGKQLFDKSTAQYGFVKSDGTVETVNLTKCTDYIKVSGSYVCMYKCISTTSTNRYCAFYDSEKNFISGVIQFVDEKNPDVPVTVDIPENAAYFRCNINPALIDSAMICVDYTPTEYEPYTGGKPSPNPDYPSPITNTYPAGTYKAICGDKVYKVVLDDDLRSVPGTADRVVIDSGRGCVRVERKVGYKVLDGAKSGYSFSEVYKSLDNVIRFRCHTINNYYARYNSTMACNYFVHSSIAWIKDIECIFWHHLTNVDFYTSISKSMLSLYGYDGETNGSAVAAANAWLQAMDEKGEPMYIMFGLETPTTHQSIPTQLLTIQSGRSEQILNTVNDKADFLKVRGDSWQLVQDKIVDEDGNVTQPAMPSPEYPSEIVSVERTLQSCGWNLFDIQKAIETATGGYQDKTYFKFDNGKTYNISCISRVESYSIWLAISATGFNSPIENAKLLFSSIGKVSMTVTIPDDGCEYYLYLCYSGRPSNSQYMNFFNGTLCEDIQITSKTHHPYDRHRGNSITLPKLRGLPDGTRDTLYVDRKAKRAWVERKVGLVESYNGESVGDVFMSNTGELSTGAVVHYKLATPVIEELPYSDYLLEMCQYETNINFVDCNENLNPKITAIVKALGNL